MCSVHRHREVTTCKWFVFQEFLHSARNYPSVSNYDFSSTCHFINSGNSNSGINQQQCDLSPSTSHVNSSEKDAGRQLVTALASHTVYCEHTLHCFVHYYDNIDICNMRGIEC